MLTSCGPPLPPTEAFEADMLPSTEADGRFSLEAILGVRLEGLVEREPPPEADETLWLRGGNGFIYVDKLGCISSDTTPSCSCLLSADVSGTCDAEGMLAWW